MILDSTMTEKIIDRRDYAPSGRSGNSPLRGEDLVVEADAFVEANERDPRKRITCSLVSRLAACLRIRLTDTDRILDEALPIAPPVAQPPISRLPSPAHKQNTGVRVHIDGAAIRRKRIAAGMTQADLAGKAHVTAATIGTWERGGHGISGDCAKRLIPVLGLTPDIAPTAKLTGELTGEEIRCRRLAAGLTQDELARRLLVSQNVVSRWELGYRVIPADCLPRLADVLP